jgi:hypothetical protein
VLATVKVWPVDVGVRGNVQQRPTLTGVCARRHRGCQAGKDNGALPAAPPSLDKRCLRWRSRTNLDEAIRRLTLIVARHISKHRPEDSWPNASGDCGPPIARYQRSPPATKSAGGDLTPWLDSWRSRRSADPVPTIVAKPSDPQMLKLAAVRSTPPAGSIPRILTAALDPRSDCRLSDHCGHAPLARRRD